MLGFTAAEKSELVEQYLLVPYGGKRAWLRERGISPYTFQRWRTAYLFGDLERGLVPRDTSGMSAHEGVVRRLEAQLRAERLARAKENVAHHAEVARLHAMNEALGKAIGLLHDLSGEQEPPEET